MKIERERENKSLANFGGPAITVHTHKLVEKQKQIKKKIKLFVKDFDRNKTKQIIVKQNEQPNWHFYNDCDTEKWKKEK